MTTIAYIRRFLAKEPVFIQKPFQMKRDASIVRVARVGCPTESEGLTLHIHTLCPSPALTSARIGTRANTEEIVALTKPNALHHRMSPFGSPVFTRRPLPGPMVETTALHE